MADQDRSFDSLVSMEETDEFEVHEGEPDPRGWSVRSADGRSIGEIDDLIVDSTVMKVRYLVCDLDEDELNLEDRDRHILIPIGHAMLDEDDQIVEVNRLSLNDITGLPAYTGIGSIGDVDTGFTAAPGQTADVDREARLTLSEEELAVGKRERRAGEVEIDKHVETEHVEKPVHLRHEEVDIERRPVSGMRAGEARIGNEEIHVPVSREEAVVEKRPVVREEIVVRKRDVDDTETVEADLRKEDVDIRDDRDRFRGD